MQNSCFRDVTSDWPARPLSALAQLNPRYPIKKGREYPFIEMASVGENFGGILKIETRKMEGSGLTRFKAGDTLFAKITPCPENGKIAFVEKLPNELGIGSTEFIVLSPRSDCVPRFLFHAVCCHEFRGRAAARMEGSTGRQRVPDDVFEKRLLIPIPPPDEQAAIARILDAVDTALERTRAAVAHARELRASLLAELLSRGVGDDDKIRDPKRTPDKFVKTPLGQLPAEWNLSRVGKEFEIQNGFTINENLASRFPKRCYLRVANVQRDALDLGEIKELEAGDEQLAPRLLAMDDLLVVEGHADRMQIGRCARVNAEAAGMTFQNHLFRLRAGPAITPEFGCLWLNSTYALRYWNACCATSSGLNTINQRMLKRLVIPVPSTQEQEKITTVIAQQRKHLDALVAKHTAFEQLKKSLMHDLLTGRVRVKPAAPAATP